MTLTASVDIYSRATLTTALSAASYVWRKNGTVFATTTVPTITDNRPQANYQYVSPSACSYTGSWSNYTDAGQAATICPTGKKWDGGTASVTFTFAGVEVAIYIDRLHPYSYTDPEDSYNDILAGNPQSWIDVTIDGVPFNNIIADAQRDTDLYTQIVWGKSGLSNGPHTVTVTPKGANVVFCGYCFSDQRTLYGSPVTYSVTANGTTETLTVSPTVDRHAVLLDQISYRLDRIVNYFTNGGTESLAYASRAADVAGMYYLTRETDTAARASLVAAINSIYTEQMAAVNPATGVLYTDTNGVSNGRAPYQWWFAYKIFGDAQFLAYAEKLVRSALAGQTFFGGPPNQVSAPLMGLAVVYNEPNSSLTTGEKSALLTLITTYASSAWGNYNSSNHWLSYWLNTGAGDYDARHPDIYQYFQWAHLRYLRNMGLGDATNMANLTSYLATKDTGASEPCFAEDTSYGTTGFGPYALLKAAIVAANGGAVPKDFIDMMYSAALDTGAWADYSPYGNDPHTGVPVDYGDGGTFFTWAMSLVYPLGVLGKDVYGFDLTTARKLRSPSGGKIRGKGAGKVSGKPQ